MRHKGQRSNHLHSAGMPFFARHRPRRGFLPALFASLALALLLAGCGEDRSNLIPEETSNSLISKINRAEALAADHKCFAAGDVAASAQAEIEGLGGKIDPELKRSLIDGVTSLQTMLSDQDICIDEGTVTEEPIQTEVPETDTGTGGTTGETGTTDTQTTTTGTQGTTTDENQNTDQTQNGDNGQQTEPTPPVTNPTSPTTPTNPTTPTTPPSTGPGSGGLGPG